MIKRCTNKKKMKNMKIEISKYFYLISYKYLKILLNLIKITYLKLKQVVL